MSDSEHLMFAPVNLGLQLNASKPLNGLSDETKTSLLDVDQDDKWLECQ